MEPSTRTSTAQRLGRSLGRGWRVYVHGERRLVNRLVTWNVPASVAKAAPWLAKAALLAVMLYAAFWLALLFLVLLAAAWGVQDADWEPPEPEWKQGPVGFGLYTYDGYRIDPHDPYDEP